MDRKVLLFGFDTLETVLPVLAALKPFGAEAVNVPPSERHRTLADLAEGGAEGGAAPGLARTPGQRALVFCGLDGELDALLSALRRAGVGPDCLKAVLTPHNRRWSAQRLLAELERERRANQR